MASLSPFWDFFDLAINQIAKTGLSSLQVIYYFESLFRIYTKIGPNIMGAKIPSLDRIESEEPISKISIDTGELGGMHANQIMLIISNEKGADVHLKNIISSSDEPRKSVLVQLMKDSGNVYVTNQEQNITIGANKYFHDGRELELINGEWYYK
ncbi:hypothetical protein [Xenorhabdus bovienii]|uniref:hypothetical protein n=1 Tax=Xenorhabdus bovienii TaxID=40576 RepID=UPI0023B22B9A|nr:hypothetical protein [Xenorhabdus bovienii]MDE9544230.1 hypothetical protein [Xenorhabdus bovienii]